MAGQIIIIVIVILCTLILLLVRNVLMKFALGHKRVWQMNRKKKKPKKG